MARQSKKRKKSQKAPGREAIPAIESGREDAQPVSPDSSGRQDDKSGERCQAPHRQVNLATCIGGMFLSLVLGVYIGTLIPDIMEVGKVRQEAKMEPASAQVAPAPALPEQAPAQKAEDTLPVGNMEWPAGIAARTGELEKALAARPADNAGWIELGNLYFDTGQAEKSIHAYEHALALEPGNADVLTDLGIMYRESGKPLKALENFRKAVAVNPRHVNALFNEGVVLSTDLGDKAGAIAAWEKLLKINPDASGPNGKTVRQMIQELR